MIKRLTLKQGVIIMKTIDEKIANFFNVSLEIVKLTPTEIYDKMKEAVFHDDFMKLHHIGYEVNKIWFVPIN